MNLLRFGETKEGILNFIQYNLASVQVFFSLLLKEVCLVWLTGVESSTYFVVLKKLKAYYKIYPRKLSLVNNLNCRF